MQHNYAQTTLELIKFSILTQEENVRRRVGSISLAGITGPEELELLEEEAHCESEVFAIFIIPIVFFFKRRNGNRRSLSFLIVYQDYLDESKVIINPERFNFLHF